MAIKGKIVYRSGEITPYEIIKAADFAQAGSKFVDTYIRSTECYQVDRADRATETYEEIEYAETGGSDDGYLDGSPYYVQITSTSTATILGLTDIVFLYCKHTGYEYSSSSALGDANTSDYIEIRTTSSSGQVIAVLAAGQSIVLPFTGGDSGVDSGDFYFQSATARLIAGTNDIAMEFICVKA